MSTKGDISQHSGRLNSRDLSSRRGDVVTVINNHELGVRHFDGRRNLINPRRLKIQETSSHVEVTLITNNIPLNLSP